MTVVNRHFFSLKQGEKNYLQISIWNFFEYYRFFIGILMLGTRILKVYFRIFAAENLNSNIFSLFFSP